MLEALKLETFEHVKLRTSVVKKVDFEDALTEASDVFISPVELDKLEVPSLFGNTEESAELLVLVALEKLETIGLVGIEGEVEALNDKGLVADVLLYVCKLTLSVEVEESLETFTMMD